MRGQLSSVILPLERAQLLDRVSTPLARALNRRVPVPVLQLLRGRWLGHPIHPALTDLPIGFWTSSWLLDLLGGKRARGTSDALIAAGLLASIPTAATGLAEMASTGRGARRVALVHATANTTATALYAAALTKRLRGDRRAGFWLAQAAAASATVGGFLGGHLAYSLGVGVRRERGHSLSRDQGEPR